jgi:hypothetical protein
MSRRTLTFAVLAAVCVVAAGVSAAIAIVGARNDRRGAARELARARPHAAQILASGRPYAVFRLVDRTRPETFGRLSIATLDGGAPGPPVLAGPTCNRVAVSAGRALCLDVLGTSMAVKVLDARMRTVADFDLPGIPSRARISPDGRWGGVTAFVVGHAYAAPGQFSTATTLIDLRTGKPVADLEKDFTVTDHGRAVTARDRNFWGLTFARDDDTFYATLETGGRTWLIQGSIKARRAHTIHGNVECPSLSPDGTRIGYKKAVTRNPTRWRFHVLDLRSGRDVALAETRSIDDQLAWLDDGHLLYGDGQQTWVVNADGSGRPRVWLPHADSATIEEGTAAAP